MQKESMPLTDNRLLVQQLVQNVLTDFIPVMDGWITSDDRMPDPFETDYSENYAPATAAVVYAGVYSFTKDTHALSQCVRMLRRSVVCLEDRTNYPFQRVFLLHYSLLALILLPQKERDGLYSEFQPFFSSYQDDCISHATNCSVLQWTTELFFVELGYRPADLELLRRSMVIIEQGQGERGFINDEIDVNGMVKDGMPTAYHYFMVFILVCAAACLDRPRMEAEPELLLQLQKSDAVIDRGLRWMAASRAPDGTYAMGERSTNQIFTWGQLAALSVYAGMDDGLVLETAQWWLPYKHADGSYSCTPNHLPHALRVGYEGYSHINMYNTLAMVGLVLAERLLERTTVITSAASIASAAPSASNAAAPSAPGLYDPTAETFIDPSSGYVFVRNGSSFFSCSIRMHKREYMPAMQGFHFRLNGEKTPLPEPGCRDWNTASPPLERNRVWEGYLLQEENGLWYMPDFQENAKVDIVEHGIRLQCEMPEYHCEKLMEITENSIKWSYRMGLSKRFASCRHVLPLLLHDGLHHAVLLEKESNVLEIRFGDACYELHCDHAVKISLSLDRSLYSVSGIAALLCLDIASSIEAGETVEWTTELRKLY